LADAARAAGIHPARVEELREVPGYGVEGLWKGQRVKLGRASWCNAKAADITATYLCTGEGSARAFTFTDRLRPGAEAAIAELTQQGKSIRLISGDTEGAVAASGLERTWIRPAYRLSYSDADELIELAPPEEADLARLDQLAVQVDVLRREKRYDALVVFSDFNDQVLQTRAGAGAVYVDDAGQRGLPESEIADTRTVAEKVWEDSWIGSFELARSGKGPVLYLFSTRHPATRVLQKSAEVSGGKFTLVDWLRPDGPARPAN
jgi:hypothetical protein